MTEGLREYDDSIGRCVHCDKLIFTKENDWVCADPPMFDGKIRIAHRDCESEYMRRASQIGSVHV